MSIFVAITFTPFTSWALETNAAHSNATIIVLGSVTEGNKVNLIAAVSKDLTAKVKAGDLIREVASYVGGKGGGRPDMAQAGGTQPEGLNKALSAVDSLVSERI